jgi:hypothetical protein
MNSRFTVTLLSAAIALLSGCSTIDTKGPVLETTETVKKGPEARPALAITSFTHGLRCMDDLMIVYGVRDLSMLVEDLVDNTKKVDAGTKDMLISAVSGMSRRSRAIRLVTFGADSGNLANFLFNAENKNAYAVIPDYDIRGSVSQLDENLARKEVDGALNISRFGIGAAKTGSTSILGVDLTMISTSDYSVIPGVTSSNSVVIFKEGSGVDSEADFNKWGINFSMTLSRSEGKAQALRTLIQLASIELVGKVSKTPYWQCVGADTTNPAIRNEIYDWYYAMATSGEIYSYMQNQLRLRGYYQGPVDGADRPEFQRAVVEYRQALGLSAEPALDLDFFTAYLAADHRKVVAQHPPQEPVAESAAAAPLQLAIRNITGGKPRRGQPVDLEVATSRDAHVYCYLRDENAQLQRFFPNRFRPDSLIQASAPLRVPGAMKFQILASEKGKPETVACFATDQDVLAQLPPTIAGADFENLSDPSLERLRAAFSGVTDSKMAEGYYHVESN